MAIWYVVSAATVFLLMGTLMTARAVIPNEDGTEEAHGEIVEKELLLGYQSLHVLQKITELLCCWFGLASIAPQVLEVG